MIGGFYHAIIESPVRWAVWRKSVFGCERKTPGNRNRIFSFGADDIGAKLKSARSRCCALPALKWGVSYHVLGLCVLGAPGVSSRDIFVSCAFSPQEWNRDGKQSSSSLETRRVVSNVFSGYALQVSRAYAAPGVSCFEALRPQCWYHSIGKILILIVQRQNGVSEVFYEEANVRRSVFLWTELAPFRKPTSFQR